MESHVVSSFDEAVLRVRSAPLATEVDLTIASDCALEDARELWKAVRLNTGGNAKLVNPEMLIGKEDAYQCIEQKLRQLRRRIANLDKLLEKINASATTLEQLVANGGPGAPGGFEPRSFHGLSSYVDVDEKIGEDELKDHVFQITSLLHQASPGSPDDDLVAQLIPREADEQLAIAGFNAEFLRVKEGALLAERDALAAGLAELEETHLRTPTQLGSGSANFARFIDHSTYAGELRGQ